MENSALLGSGAATAMASVQPSKPSNMHSSILNVQTTKRSRDEDEKILSFQNSEKNVQVSKELLDSVVRKVSDEIQARNVQLNISVNEKLNRFVVQVNDKRTGETIKQYPSEDFVAAAENLKDLSGILFSKNV